ncbi:MAG TPA: secretin N-terminal domain-containing protein, partial [Candidatus Acidoferrales bacterium]|nr:secretin N-terminal domain-containing protein [Candidatus Acidoferrales bacterium]
TTNTPPVAVADTNAAAPVVAAPVAPADATNVAPPAVAPVTAATTTPDATAPTNAAPAMATTAPPDAAATTNIAPAAAMAPTNAAPADAGTPAPAASIPLIQFSDVPITTAIENLARQASINYMLDPKIGYGQPDATGQIKAEPTLSIRWENISAENALVALLDNYGLQLNRDKKTGIDRITMKDPTAPPPLITRVIQLQYASVTNMQESVQSALTDKRSKVLGDRRTSQMVIVATEPEQSAVDTLIKQLDTPTKQVLIETKLIQISSQPSTHKGVDWSSTLSAQTVTFGNGSLSGNTVAQTPGAPVTVTDPGGHTGTVTPPTSSSTILNLLQGSGGFSASTMAGLIPMTGFLNADGLKATISFLNSSFDAQVMSTPRVVTLDNETAVIQVTRQVPIINFSGGTQNSSGSSSVTYSNVGTILEVTPRISANEKIWLKVAPEVSSKFGDETITIPGNAQNPSFSFPVPIFDIRRLTTQVLIPNGNTLVMGGLVQDAPSATYTKVPMLGDIPGLGWAFRSETKAMSKDNLIIFMTPTIVQDTDFRATPSDFLQSKPHSMKSPMDPHDMWDSGEARGHWDNPAPAPGEFDQKPPLNNY